MLRPRPAKVCADLVQNVGALSPNDQPLFVRDDAKDCDCLPYLYVKLVSREGAAVHRDRIVYVADDAGGARSTQKEALAPTVRAKLEFTVRSRLYRLRFDAVASEKEILSSVDSGSDLTPHQPGEGAEA